MQSGMLTSAASSICRAPAAAMSRAPEILADAALLDGEGDTGPRAAALATLLDRAFAD